MQYPYFPGCTLTNKAKGLNDMAKAGADILGAPLKELENWYCCQANFSSVTDNLMNHLAPVRTLIAAAKEGQKLVVLCSTCYYVLKRVSAIMARDEEKRKVVYEFLEEEYTKPVEVVHFLEYVRDEVGFDKLKENVKMDISVLAIAPYYGCQLLRPSKELAFDDPFEPSIFEEFLGALGCESVDSPFKTECCGSFLTTFSEKGVEDCVDRVLTYAGKNGAEAVTTSCPLCNFNLDWAQKEIKNKNEKFNNMPVFYLTELMALALGIEVPVEVWDEHVVDPRPFLAEKGIVKRTAL